jgi:hypothetical protein
MTHKNFEMIAKGLQFIHYDIAGDEQFDPTNELYCGFLNVGLDTVDDQITWKFICNNPDIFKPIISKLGLKLEGGVLNIDETVFIA